MPDWCWPCWCGDWDVEEMINDIFVDEDITIVRYVPSK
jgi:hypothetical protein